MIIVFIFAVIIVLIGLAMLFFLKREKSQLGILAESEPIYHDSTDLPAKVLYATSLPLVGKPDALIKDGDQIIPVENKTGKSPRQYFIGHNMQLMAYCLLVEENYGIRPKGGILRYNDKEVKYMYTKEAEESVRKVVQEILKFKQIGKAPQCDHPNHNS